MKWNGADFHIGSVRQCFNILEGGRLNREKLEKLQFVQSLNLYSVATQEGATVNIVAGSFTVKDEEGNLLQ
jgi:hypothetical protein